MTPPPRPSTIWMIMMTPLTMPPQPSVATKAQESSPQAPGKKIAVKNAGDYDGKCLLCMEKGHRAKRDQASLQQVRCQTRWPARMYAADARS